MDEQTIYIITDEVTESLNDCNGVVINLLALVYRLSDADRQHVPPEDYREK